MTISSTSDSGQSFHAPPIQNGRKLFKKLETLRGLYHEIRNLPRISINLMVSETESNNPFFNTVTRDFYLEASKRHSKFPLVRQMEIGLATCMLKGETKKYSERLDSAARRNLKKAARLGYRFECIDYNAHLPAITAIHQSAPVRQGRDMPADLLARAATPHRNPPSTNPCHDYPYFGIFKEDLLVAYASCFVAGEMCALNTIFGHADYLADGVVPMLIASIGDDIPQRHPTVKYYTYGLYFGASETLKRFKRKFLFQPQRVTWILGE